MGTPENGNIAEVAQRFPAQRAKDISNSEYRDFTPIQEARGGHFSNKAKCPLLGVKRTWCGLIAMSAYDPKRITS
jgi:hypothetical protein